MLQKTTADWSYLTEPQQEACLGHRERRSSWPRGKVLGGTSVLNVMIYVRGNRHDYDLWEKMGATGWSWKDVLPHFIKSEDIQDANFALGW
jgi:PREDICTED: similar to AGAP002557-PA